MHRAIVPFYSQMVNWNGEDSGFPNTEEVQRWENNCCGIACARMVIHFFTGATPGYWDLLQRGLERNAYVEAGWIHRGLVDLAAEFGVGGTAHRNKTIVDVRNSVAEGSICIVSVTAGFRGGQLKKGTEVAYAKGGHLVVALAVEPRAVVCHHPSSYGPMNKEYWTVPMEDWERSFSGNYMEFHG